MVIPLAVERVPVLSDNYSWLLHDPASGATAVVDPGEAAPVLAAAATKGWQLTDVWITHWHGDHTGGIAGVRAGADVRVVAPRAEAGKVAGADGYLDDGDEVRLGAHSARVIATPGHTLGHLAFHLADEALLFPGDTLFAIGCGRLFEGTPAQMHDSLARLAALPGETQVFAGHEYTLGNARWAVTAEPDNTALAERAAAVERMRAAGEPTLPTTIAAERATNPFVRARNAEALAALRASKDRFRG
jgi:hydroxyacylglutathione hydrolase